MKNVDLKKRLATKRFVVEIDHENMGGEKKTYESSFLTFQAAHDLARDYRAMGHEVRVIEKAVEAE